MRHQPYYRALPTNWAGGDEPTRAECTCGFTANVMPSLTVARQAFVAHRVEVQAREDWASSPHATPCYCGSCEECTVRDRAWRGAFGE